MIKFSNNRNWHLSYFKGNKIYYYGNYEIVQHIANSLIKNNFLKNELFINFIKEYDFTFFGFIISINNKVFACSDHCRSKPIFYSYEKKNFKISNDSNLLKKNKKIREKSKIEFELSGYVTNNFTLYENLFQLEAGSYVIYDEKTNNLVYSKYFNYLPNRYNKQYDFEYLYNDLNNRLNRIFKYIKERNNKNNFWVALSGGKDSALVLLKLIESGCKQINAYTYGSKFNNDDAIKAKNICKKLNINWVFIEVKAKNIDKFINSREYKDYNNFVSDNSSIPNFLDLFALIELKNKKYLNNNSVILNGHTGDFISGGHIPNFEKKKNVVLEDQITKKHFSLFNKNVTNAKIKLIKENILSKFNKIEKNFYSKENLYEFWEYEERQAKFILNGQKNYDFLQVKYFTPLWEFNIINFFRNLDTNYKINQKFYIKFLNRYNYKKIFKNKNFQNQEWSGLFFFVTYFLFFIKLIFGNQIRNKIQILLRYFGQNHYLYSIIPFRKYLKEMRYVKNPYAYWVKRYLKMLN